ncbi:M3 family oligoendopeptidase [Rossellomorea aquimaris]|uniref:M3 family oligoendopeptidase n=1 Tax=Rossellomorea aquimaris TaxID=189382 RepID=UPI001CD2A813|nr:M3 family oligoendopeptidase [Rossellomorea aquimaris]MCA1057638.1 M3 family oligoendopeptidase [Rossellomorea aquimaris]
MKVLNEKFIHIDIDKYESKFYDLLHQFENANSAKEQSKWFMKLNDHRFIFETNFNSARLRHYREMNNELFATELNVFTKMEPRYLELVGYYYRTILRATYRDHLEGMWGKQIFRLAELKQSLYSDKIEDELEKENQLIMEYQSLLGKAVIHFSEQQMNLSELTPYLNSSDRQIRKDAHLAKYQFFQKNERRFDELLDGLVHVRNTIANKLGHSSFVKLGYQRMHRTGHTPDDLEKYRTQVEKYGVPFVSKLREAQEQRIGVDKLNYYDEGYLFADGSPSPKGTHQEMINKFKTFFSELSPETKVFIDEMLSHDLIDLTPRKDKMVGNFATYIGPDKHPFMFINLHGIANDIRIFTHEAGHACQFHMSRHWNVPEYIIPYDSAELFSFGMERLSWPCMEDFFGSNTKRYQYSHLISAFMYMPLASAVDEFEHFLYEQPAVSIEERKSKWAELERKYIPERDYDGNKFLERGTGFYEISHLFTTPFYFMDYDLAHLCAVQLWRKHQENPKEALMGFLEMCRNGGKLPFKELIKIANIKSPFEENSIQPILEFVEEWIERVEVSVNK